jgi:hypothetical protein
VNQLELTGAKPEAELYACERRAQRLVVEKPVVTIALKPTNHCVNPVFELCDAPKTLACLSLDGKRLHPLQYAWDRMTLWLNVTFSHPAELKLEFGTE